MVCRQADSGTNRSSPSKILSSAFTPFNLNPGRPHGAIEQARYLSPHSSIQSYSPTPPLSRCTTVFPLLYSGPVLPSHSSRLLLTHSLSSYSSILNKTLPTFSLLLYTNVLYFKLLPTNLNSLISLTYMSHIFQARSKHVLNTF